LKTRLLSFETVFMTSVRFLVAALLCVANAGWVQAGRVWNEPALVGNGPKSLVNMMSEKRLMARGQKDALLMFVCYVNPAGVVGGNMEYGETAGAKALKQEVRDAMVNCRFIPAIYHGSNTDVIFYGTVVFFIVNGQPHLRIYANQNKEDIRQGRDFIAPQMMPDSFHWENVAWSMERASINVQNGVVERMITVDVNGNPTKMKVIREDPKGYGFADALQKASQHAKYIPGYRDGRPVACTFYEPQYIVSGRFFAYKRS
jgi:Gram-negative bacterial TonB protein C-terminal